MNQLMQWGPVAVIVGGYLLGILFQNRRIDDLKETLQSRIDSEGKRSDARFDAIDKRFDDLRDLLKSETKRLEDRIERLEHPVSRR